MGHLQKIMYVHVPSAWVAMIAFFVRLRGEPAYLIAA
jgi:ABC-type transport system involved in cytochrome c biogenesis permease subunit